MAKKKKVLYFGVFLDQPNISVDYKHGKHYLHHMTTCFKPSESDVEKFKPYMGKEFRLVIAAT